MFKLHREKKNNAQLMEANTVITERAGDIWVTVDSGAPENVISGWMASQFKAEPSSGGRNVEQYVAADGKEMPNSGEKDVKLTTEERHRCALKMQVAEVQKLLMSVARMCDAGQGWRHH